MRRSGVDSLLILALCCLWPGIKVYSWMLYVASYRKWTGGPNAGKKLFDTSVSTTLLVGRCRKGDVGWITSTASRRCIIHSSSCRALKNDDSEAATLSVRTCSGGREVTVQNRLSITPKRPSKIVARKKTAKQISTTRLTDNNPSANALLLSRRQGHSANGQVRKNVNGGETPRKSKKYVRVRPAMKMGSAAEDCVRSSICASVVNKQIPGNAGNKERRIRTGNFKKQSSQEYSRHKETGPFIWDPNQRQVSLTYNRSAKDIFSWISLSTHMYGPMLDRKRASSTTHEERIDWLKSWVSASDRHGVLPDDLAFLLDQVGWYSNNRYTTSGNNKNKNLGARKTFENMNGGEDKEIRGLCLWPRIIEKRDKKERGDECCSSSTLVESNTGNDMFNSNEMVVLDRNKMSGEVEVVDDEEDLAEDLIEEKVIFPANVKGSGRSSTRLKVPPVTISCASSNEPEPEPGGEGLLCGTEEPSAIKKAEQESESLGNLLYDAVHERLKSRHPRVIVVGDVHGCVNELKELIRRVEYHPGDLLVFLGDLVCKGPHSNAVVTLARELGAVAVRGNHEYEVLRQYHLHTKWARHDPPTKLSEHYRISQNLSTGNVEWLEASPWYMKSVDLDALFVHAGLIHGVQLKKQNPRLMMNMRSILPDGTVTSKYYGEWPWARMWEGPQTVFFGHDAQRGLQIHEHGIGLDTGCVYGKRLTACVLPERQLVSVACCKPYRTSEVRRAKQQQIWPEKK